MAVVDDREATFLKFGLMQVIIFGLLAFSLIFSHKNLTLLLLILLAFVYGAMLWSRFSLDRLEVCSSFDRGRVFPGEAVQLHIIAENRKVLPVWLRVIVPIPGSVQNDFGLEVPIREQGLLWYQSVRFSWQLMPQHRGIYRLGPPEVKTGDLLGIYPRIKELNQQPLDLIVYPRLISLRPFAHIKKDLFGSPGAKCPVEDPVYLLGTREYHAGRPSRYIHWTASARLNCLQERVFEPSQQARVLFVLDVSRFAAASASECFEKTISGLASLAVECERQGFAVGLVTNGTLSGSRSPLVSIARSARQSTMILEALAGVEMTCCSSTVENLVQVKGLNSGASCVFFSLYPHESSQDAIGLLNRKKISVTLVCCEEPENSSSLREK
ncbi:MAG: DUF58 domain-containing protein, partial [Desulforhopalus sp.]